MSITTEKKATIAKKQDVSVINCELKRGTSKTSGSGVFINEDIVDYFEALLKPYKSKMTGKAINAVLEHYINETKKGNVKIQFTR